MCTRCMLLVMIAYIWLLLWVICKLRHWLCLPKCVALPATASASRLWLWERGSGGITAASFDDCDTPTCKLSCSSN